jgi:hypothetical protein
VRNCAPMIEKAAFALSANEAWVLLACFTLQDVLLVPFAWKKKLANSWMRLSKVAGPKIASLLHFQVAKREPLGNLQ